jgi:cytochrome b
MDNSTSSGPLSMLPLVILSLAAMVVANLLAREKGRPVAVWTILAALPVVNFVCVWYFVGAANLRLEAKLDRILSALEKEVGRSVDPS